MDIAELKAFGEQVKSGEIDKKTLLDFVSFAVKMGRRNSEGDLSKIQTIHDSAEQLGARCGKSFMDKMDGKSFDTNDHLMVYGREIKSLSDDGKVGGYLVEFTDANNPDLDGDFFYKNTDFGPHRKSLVYYAHGVDPKFGKKSIGIGELSIDDVGVWIETQLNVRDKYERAVYDLVKAQKLGWSSGTAPHLVERKQVSNSATFIERWPLGLDASMTPAPANHRSQVVSLKQVQIPDLFDVTSNTIKIDDTTAQEIEMILLELDLGE